MDSAWQPIETAPRDGTRILAYIPRKVTPAGERSGALKRHPQVIVITHWASAPADLPGRQIGDRARLFDGMYGGYWSARQKGTRPLHALPTHWMPLPEAPR